MCLVRVRDTIYARFVRESPGAAEQTQTTRRATMSIICQQLIFTTPLFVHHDNDIIIFIMTHDPILLLLISAWEHLIQYVRNDLLPPA